MRPQVSIIIPTKNEEEGIAKVICGIPQKVLEISEVIVVDNSSDLTPVIAERLGAKVVKVRKEGKGYAMKVGVKEANSEVIVFLDGDGTDSPQYIPKLLRKLEKSDMVLGCRTIDSRAEKKIYKLIFSSYIPFVNSLFKLLGFGIPFGFDPLAGFRALRKDIWERMNLKANDFLIETEMNLRAVDLGLKVSFVRIPLLPRAGGLLNSKLVKNFDQWVKIFNYCLNYAKDNELKKKVKELEQKFREAYSETFDLIE